MPGNHDVNIVDRANTGRFDLPGSISHALRRLRFVIAPDDIEGERVHIVDRASGRGSVRLTSSASVRSRKRDSRHHVTISGDARIAACVVGKGSAFRAVQKLLPGC